MVKNTFMHASEKSSGVSGLNYLPSSRTLCFGRSSYQIYIILKKVNRYFGTLHANEFQPVCSDLLLFPEITKISWQAKCPMYYIAYEKNVKTVLFIITFINIQSPLFETDYHSGAKHLNLHHYFTLVKYVKSRCL